MARLGDDQGFSYLIQILISIIQLVCETEKTCKSGGLWMMVVMTIVFYFIASFVEAALHAGDLNYQRIVGNIRLLAGSLTVVLFVLIINIPYFGLFLLSLWICVFIWQIWNSYEELIELLCQALNLLKNTGRDALRGMKKLAASVRRSEPTDQFTRDANGSTHDTVEEGDAEQTPV